MIAATHAQMFYLIQIKNKLDEIKKNLGLPLDKKIILYTPTWRKKGFFDMQLDLDKMKERLGDEYVILVRLHHFAVRASTVLQTTNLCLICVLTEQLRICT